MPGSHVIRISIALLVLALGACTTTSTVQQPVAPAQGRAYAFSFENSGGDDLAGIASLARIIQGRLQAAGLLQAGGPPGAGPAAGRVEVELTRFRMRSHAARAIAGILAGRDTIASRVTVLGPDGTPLGRFEVETTNLSAWGSAEGLMEQHADEIVARLQPAVPAPAR